MTRLTIHQRRRRTGKRISLVSVAAAVALGFAALFCWSYELFVWSLTAFVMGGGFGVFMICIGIMDDPEQPPCSEEEVEKRERRRL